MTDEQIRRRVNKLYTELTRDGVKLSEEILWKEICLHGHFEMNERPIARKFLDQLTSKENV